MKPKNKNILNFVQAKESIKLFFQISNKIERETFLDLFEYKKELAIDFFNCWLILNNINPIEDKIFKSSRVGVIIKHKPKMKIKRKVKE